MPSRPQKTYERKLCHESRYPSPIWRSAPLRKIISEATNQVWDLIKEGKLHIDIEQAPLKDVESAWQRTDLYGKRIVIVP
jgi:hypothetical protein